MSHVLGPRLLVEVGSVVATCPVAQTSSPCRDGLRHCHVSHGLGPRLPAKVSFIAATCPEAPDPTSLRGELWCCHVFHDPQQAVNHRNKERLR
jgi:hypothetical protein